jgi:hypothetical protein
VYCFFAVLVEAAGVVGESLLHVVKQGLHLGTGLLHEGIHRLGVLAQTPAQRGARGSRVGRVQGREPLLAESGGKGGIEGRESRQIIKIMPVHGAHILAHGTVGAGVLPLLGFILLHNCNKVNVNIISTVVNI